MIDLILPALINPGLHLGSNTGYNMFSYFIIFAIFKELVKRNVKGASVLMVNTNENRISKPNSNPG